MAVPDGLEDRLEEPSPEQLDDISRLAERLAEGKRRDERIQEKEEGETATDIKGDLYFDFTLPSSPRHCQ